MSSTVLISMAPWRSGLRQAFISPPISSYDRKDTIWTRGAVASQHLGLVVSVQQAQSWGGNWKSSKQKSACRLKSGPFVDHLAKDLRSWTEIWFFFSLFLHLCTCAVALAGQPQAHGDRRVSPCSFRPPLHYTLAHVHGCIHTQRYRHHFLK